MPMHGSTTAIPLLLVEGLHQLGAAIWIGGMPCFLMALAAAMTGCNGGASASASR
jgi:putative copper export protein